MRLQREFHQIKQQMFLINGPRTSLRSVELHPVSPVSGLGLTVTLIPGRSLCGHKRGI